MKTILRLLLISCMIGIPAYNQPRVASASRTVTLQSPVTKTASFSGTNSTDVNVFAYRDLIVTLDITAADRDDANETYDVYITTSDGVSSWDLVHFPQVATTGAKRYTALVSGYVYPQNVSTAAPGVQAVTTAILRTDTAGTDNGIKTLGAGLVRHGPWGTQIGHEAVIAGTTPSITYSITVTFK